MEAHLRLLELLPKRTHEFKPKDTTTESNFRRPLIVYGKKYNSVREAVTFLHVSTQTIYNMLDDGRAKYVEERK